MSNQEIDKYNQQGQFTPELSIQRIYTKKVSFNSLKTPAIFEEDRHPKMHIDVNSRYKAIDQKAYEVTLAVTLRASHDEVETYCLVEFQQAGLFQIQGFSGTRLEQALLVQCPAILFPYARELLDSSMIRGGFPPLSLAPPNFEALYQALLQKRGDASASSEPDPSWGSSDGDTDITH